MEEAKAARGSSITIIGGGGSDGVVLLSLFLFLVLPAFRISEIGVGFIRIRKIEDDVLEFLWEVKEAE